MWGGISLALGAARTTEVQGKGMASRIWQGREGTVWHHGHNIMGTSEHHGHDVVGTAGRHGLSRASWAQACYLQFPGEY